MKSLAIFFLSVASCFAGRYAVVQGGTVENVVLWDGVGASPFSGITVNLEQNSNASQGDLYDGEKFERNAPEISLRQSLRTVFTAAPEKCRAQLMGVAAAVEFAFENGESEKVIYSMIDGVNPGDDPEMIKLKESILILPQWSK